MRWPRRSLNSRVTAQEKVELERMRHLEYYKITVRHVSIGEEVTLNIFQHDNNCLGQEIVSSLSCQIKAL